MDVQFDLSILDFSMHKKGFSVQRCQAAVRGALTREFGAMPVVFFAPRWVAQYFGPSDEVQIAGGGYDSSRLVKERIARVSGEHPGRTPRVLVASYNHYVRVAAREAGALYGVNVGTIMLSDYVNDHFAPQKATVEWSGAMSTQPQAVPPQNAVLSQPPPAPPTEVLVTPTPTDTSENHQDPYHRSREMRSVLLKAKLFNEKPVRDLLFSAVQPILARGESLQLSKLRRTLAEESFPSSGMSDKGKWDTQVYFFCRLLLFSGTLLGSDGPLVHGAGSDGIEVVKLSPTMKDDAEAYLLELVIRERGDVTEFEHCPLAHAVLRSFSTDVDIFDLKDRVAFLISRFADRLGLSETGTYIHQATKVPSALRAVK
jgi:hypothetical protein